MDRLSDTLHQRNFLSKHVEMYIGILHNIHNDSKSTQYFKMNFELYQCNVIVYMEPKSVSFAKIVSNPRMRADELSMKSCDSCNAIMWFYVLLFVLTARECYL